MIRAIVFDLDGVIVTGSNEGYFRCADKVAKEIGLRLSFKTIESRVLKTWGKSGREVIKEVVKYRPKKFQKAYQIYEECIDSEAFTGPIRLIEGAKETLKELSKQYKLALITAMKRRVLEKIIKDFKIDYFGYLISSYDLLEPELQKPSAYPLRLTMEKLKVSEKEIIYVGDSKSDIEMANNAETKVVIVLTGLLTRKEAERHNPYWIIQTVTNLPHLLKML